MAASLDPVAVTYTLLDDTEHTTKKSTVVVPSATLTQYDVRPE